MAVDLVHHAYNRSFDVALLSSGDLDLLESIRLVKNLGKKVIIVSHHKNMSPTLRKEADFFFSLGDLPQHVLDRFAPIRSHCHSDHSEQ